MPQDILAEKFKKMFELRNAEHKVDWKKYRKAILIVTIIFLIFFGWFFIILLGAPIFLIFAYLFSTIPNNTFNFSEFGTLISLAVFFWGMVIVPAIMVYVISKGWILSRQKALVKLHMKSYLQREILPVYLKKKFTKAYSKDGTDLIKFSRVLSSIGFYKNDHERITESLSGVSSNGGSLLLNQNKNYSAYKLIGTIEDSFSITDKSEHYQFAEATVSLLINTENGKKVTPFGNMFTVATPADFKFNGETVVYTKEMFDIDTKGLEEDDMESTLFEDKFFVFTSDPVEARICLKTNVIDQINQLYDQGVKKMFIEFKNNNVIIGVENHLKLFEPVFHREMTEQDLDGSVEEIKKLLTLAEELKINYKSYK